MNMPNCIFQNQREQNEMTDRMLKILACTVFFIWILILLSSLVYEKLIRFIYVDNRRMSDNGTYLARQAGKLKKAGLNHGCEVHPNYWTF